MLDIILEREITERKDLLVVRGDEVEELSGKEDVLICREDGIFTISTNKGCIGIKAEGEKWMVGYTSLEIEDLESMYVPGDNAIVDEWYNDFKNSKVEKDNYVRLPSFDKTLSFEDAYELSSYLLFKTLPKAHSQNRMIN